MNPGNDEEDDSARRDTGKSAHIFLWEILISVASERARGELYLKDLRLTRQTAREGVVVREENHLIFNLLLQKR